MAEPLILAACMGTEYLKPSFFIIGERKCGTSSLYRYLCDHPKVVPCRMKEPQFFSSPAWYRILNYRKYLALFPEKESAEPVHLEWVELVNDSSYVTREVEYKRTGKADEITGEASANTLSQVPPDRLYRYFPDARLIVLLRDPVDRAISHHSMLKRFHNEGRRLPFKPGSFETDVQIEIENVLNGKQGYFIPPGIYIRNLRKWFRQFPADQFKVILAEELHDLASGKRLLDEVRTFLDLEQYEFGPVMQKKFNVSGKPDVAASVREQVASFYRPHNEELREFLKRDLPWT